MAPPPNETTTTTETTHHGGVVFRVRAREGQQQHRVGLAPEEADQEAHESEPDLFFLPASIAMKVMPIPEMARVPGAPIELRGVALVDGDMIPVVELGASEIKTGGGVSSGAMLVCVIVGERLGLVGIDVLATGRFEIIEPARTDGTEGDPEPTREEPAFPSVKHGGEIARPFDVAEVIGRVREGRWAV